MVRPQTAFQSEAAVEGTIGRIKTAIRKGEKVMQLTLLEGLSRTNEVRPHALFPAQQPAAMPRPKGGIFDNVLAAVFVSLISVVLLSTGAVAQEFRGTISGTITDPSGAVVPGAKVEVQESSTGTINRTTSDKAGQYSVPFLAPGDYTITVSKPGFETLSRGGITLQAQEHPIIDLALTVGNATQTVTVTAEAPLVDQANASVGQVISTESVEDLPLNGRTPVVLTTLSVGVVTTSAPGITHPFDNNAANSWSIGGTPNQVSEVLLDGSPDLTLLGAQAYSPTQDSVQEVSVRPFDTDASFGHTIGGVINQVTKSGSNSLHGTMYEFNQIPNLDANLYFNSAPRQKSGIAKPTPVFHFNQYGLTAGGPVLVPKLFNGKNKLFFFFAWEGLKDNAAATQITTVPTDAERQGDFSALLALGPSYQLYHPNTGTVSGGKFTRTTIPNNCLTNLSTYCSGVANAGYTINPVAAAYLKFFPEPNATGTSTGANNYNSNAPSIDTYDNEFGRLDYNLNDRNHVFFDYRHNHRTQVKNNYFANDSTGTTLLRENFGTTLDDVFTLNSTTVFDVRANWTFFNEVHGTPAQSFSPASVGLPTGLQTGSTEVQLPFIQFAGNATSASCGSFTSFQCLGDNTSAIDPTTSYQIFADMVKLVGKHALKIGFDGRQYRLRVQNFGNSSGTFTAGPSFMTKGTGATAPPFGADLASFLIGLPTAGQYDLNTRADYHSYYIGTFVQDDWRLNNQLTVNIGVRFDIDTPYGEKFGRTVNGFDPTATNSVSSAAMAAFKVSSVTVNGTTVAVNSLNALGGLTFPSASGGAPYQTIGNGFWSPRVGFSYNPTFLKGRMVVRGGFGTFVQPETLASLAATGSYSSNALNNQEGFSASTAYAAATDSTYFQSAGSISNPFPNGFTQPTGSSLGASTFLGSPSAVSFLAPSQHDPYSERWNLGTQYMLTGSTLLEMLYVGNHALHLPVASQNINATELQYLTTNPYTDFNLNTATGTAVANPFAGLLPANTKFNGTTTSLGNLLVPYPQFGNTAITEQNETIGQSFFHSGMIHVQQRAKHGLTLTANYSFAKLIEQDTRLNDQDVALTRRVSPFDHTHHFTVGGTYDLPFGRGKVFNFGDSKLMDGILGGFVINSIYQFQTGAPIYFSSDIPLQPGMTVKDIKSSPRETSLLGGALVNASNVFATGTGTCAAPAVCDGTVFVNNPNYYSHYRTLPQTIGSVRMDGFNNMDASILKNIKFTEKAHLQLRFETFNTLNHPVFAAPSVTATSSSFGIISGVPSTAQPRQVQLGGRIVF
jgi:hypothetical protein